MPRALTTEVHCILSASYPMEECWRRGSKDGDVALSSSRSCYFDQGSEMATCGLHGHV